MNGTHANSTASCDPVAGAAGKTQPMPRRSWCSVDVQTVSMTSPSRWVKNDKIVSGSTSGGQHTKRGSPAGSPVPARSGMTLTNSRMTQVQQPFLAATLMNPLSPRSRAYPGKRPTLPWHLRMAAISAAGESPMSPVPQCVQIRDAPHSRAGLAADAATRWLMASGQPSRGQPGPGDPTQPAQAATPGAWGVVHGGEPSRPPGRPRLPVGPAHPFNPNR